MKIEIEYVPHLHGICECGKHYYPELHNLDMQDKEIALRCSCCAKEIYLTEEATKWCWKILCQNTKTEKLAIC